MLVLTKNTTTTQYMYDHLGQRLEKARGTGTTTYVGGGYEIAPGNSVTKYIYAGGELEATIAGIGTTTTSYIHRDHLSSTNVTTNQSGAVSTVLDYYPYGSPRIETGTPPQRQYIGQYDDSESDLAYLNARYYDSSRGQFTSQDPMHWAIPTNLIIDPQLQNSYGYARNNPILYKDATGELPVIPLLLAAGAAGGVIGQFIEDVAAGQPSSWQDYIGAAAGGVTGVVAAFTTKNPYYLGAVTSGSEELYTNVLKGEETFNNVLNKAGEGALFGKFGTPNVPGFNSGRNSITARSQSAITRASNNPGGQATTRTFSNVTTAQAGTGFTQSTWNGVNNRLSNNQINKATNYIEKANNAIKAGNYSEAMRQLQKVNQTISAPKSKPRSR